MKVTLRVYINSRKTLSKFDYEKLNTLYNRIDILQIPQIYQKVTKVWRTQVREMAVYRKQRRTSEDVEERGYWL